MPLPSLDSLVIQTRARWPIPNDLRPERPDVSLAAAVKIWGARFPAISLRSISNRYNCVGMVVAFRRVWAYPEDLIRILLDDGYRKLDGPEQTDVGDIAVYHDADGEPCHVGVILHRNILIPGDNQDPFTLLRKWGGDGEYIHKVFEVPECYGRVAEYWTDRRRP